MALAISVVVLRHVHVANRAKLPAEPNVRSDDANPEFRMPPIIFLAGIICGSAVLITAMMLISRHISLRRLSSRALPTDEIVGRLERIEQTVETTAIEVERLAESSRFVTKLLAGEADARRS